MVIAIDGPAGSGKSTVARLLAERLGYTYVNSGNIYRAIALGCVRKGVSYEDQDAAGAYAAQAAIAYRDGAVYLDGEPVDPLLHTDEIDKFTPPLSAIPEVRAAVNRLIRQIAGRIDIIAEGRDMTTAVFPDAEHRFYLDASAEERAKRRFQQGVSQLSLEEIQRAIEERDKIDKNKAEGSLKIAPGVRVFDTSRLTIEEVYAILVATIKPKKNITEGSSMTQEVEMDESKHSADHIQTQLQMEEYLKTLESLEEGQIVEGAVIAVTEDQVFVDVGYKSEGKIPIAEFPEPPQVGDEVAVILIAKENKHGEVIVSKQKADIKLLWKNLRQAFQDRTLVEGTVESLVKGGYDFNLGEGVHAFLPISQSDSQKVDKPERLLGLKTPVYVERLYSDGKVNIVVNRRKWLEEAVEQKRADFF
ncbi:MAG: (d)CMP kinase, partial [Spirochaetaceae bacterium]|nr:(d)CMP kinase [Spirochaetaceae bacterium]